MPRTPRTILLRLTVETAKRTRKCSRSKTHAVRPDARLLLVREHGPASRSQGYCLECAGDMLAAAHQQLVDLDSMLHPPEPT